MGWLVGVDWWGLNGLNWDRDRDRSDLMLWIGRWVGFLVGRLVGGWNIKEVERLVVLVRTDLRQHVSFVK